MSGVIGGQIHVAEVESVGIVGVAMWFGPQQKFMLTWVQVLVLKIFGTDISDQVLNNGLRDGMIL